MSTYDAGKIEARLVLDRSEFNHELDQAKADADKFSGKDYAARFKADTTAADKAITATQARADKLGKSSPTVKVAVDDAQAQARIAQTEARIQRLGNIVARPKVSPEAQKAYAELDKLNTLLDELGKKTPSPKVDADTAAAKARVDELNVKLDRLETRDTEVRVKASADMLRAKADLEKIQHDLDRINSSSSTSGLDRLQKIADKLKGGGPTWLGPLLLALPALGTLTGAAGAAGIGMAGAFTAGAGAVAAFGSVAKPVLADAMKAQAAVSAAQGKYTIAIANGTKPAAAYKAEQIAIAKAYMQMSPAQIALSKQLGDMAQGWQNLKAAQTPVVAGALQPWLRAVTDLTKNLGPIIAKVSPVIASLGTQFDGLVNSATFKAFRDFIGSTGTAAVSATGSTLIDFFKGFMTLLPQFDPLIREAVGWISRLGPAFVTWAGSQKTADHIQDFMRWFSQNGPVVGGLLKNIGAALKTLAPGLAAGGTEELKVLSGFFGFIAKLPPRLAAPLAETAGALLLLNKLGVFSVGVKFVGLAAGWVKKLLGGAAVDIGAAGMQRAGNTMVAAAGAMQKAANTMVAAGGEKGSVPGGVAGDAEKAAGGAGGAGAAVAGLSIGSVIAGVGLLANAAYVRSQQKGGILGATAPSPGFVARFGPVGGPGGAPALAAPVAADTTAVGQLAAALHEAHAPAAQIYADLQNQIKALQASGPLNAAETLQINQMKQAADAVAVSTFGWTSATKNAANALQANMLPQLSQMKANTPAVRADIDRLATSIINTGTNSSASHGARQQLIQDLENAHVNAQTAKAWVDKLQGSIDNLHGKTVQIHMNGQGLYTITGSAIAKSQGKGGSGNAAGGLAAGGLIRMGSGPTADDVPAMLSRGELVVPAHMVRAGAVDHLRGALPGFAAGGQVGGSAVSGNLSGPYVTGMYSAFQRQMQDAMVASMKAAMKSAVAAAVKAAASVAGNVNYKPSAGVEQWRGVVLKALSLAGASTSLANNVLHQMQTESGGNPTIVNHWDCVTLDYVILTKRGWLRHDQVQAGDETIGYNPETGRSEWTRVTRVVRYEDAEVWRIGNKHWHAEVTPNHRWWSDTLTRVQPAAETCPECGWVPRGTKAPARGVQVHRSKIHGINATRGPRNNLRGEFVQTRDLGAGHRIRVAAPADTDGLAGLSLEDVRIIAWLQGDGTLTRVMAKPSVCPECGWVPQQRKPSRGEVRQPQNSVAVHRAHAHGMTKDRTEGEPAGWDGSIFQSKPAMVTKIRALLAHVQHGEHVRQRAEHHMPAHHFKLNRAFVTDLIKRSAVLELGPEAFVLALSPDQRAAWLDSMIDAEGHRQTVTTTGERRGGSGEFVRIAQVDGPLQEAIKLAVYLEGYRPTFTRLSGEKNGYQPSGLVGMARPHVAPSMFAPHEVLERQPVWCVTTELGTWTTRGGDATPFLTGNSNAKAGTPSVGLLAHAGHRPDV